MSKTFMEKNFKIFIHRLTKDMNRENIFMD